MDGKSQIKNIWGLAKANDLNKDELYYIIGGLTGKDSMRALSVKERNIVIAELGRMKDKGETKGQLASEKQIWKIHELEKQLGWSGEPARLKGYLKKRFGVERLNWISRAQAWRVIEGLKKMVERKGENHDNEIQL